MKKKVFKSLLLLALLPLLAMPARPQPQHMWLNQPPKAAVVNPGTPFITGQTLGTIRNNYTGFVGFEFSPSTVPVVNFHITALGRWIVSGNSGSHYVIIGNPSLCTSLASVQINTVGQTAGKFAYVALATPLACVSGVNYYCASSETSGGDQWYDKNTTVTTTSAASIFNVVVASGTTPGTFTGCGTSSSADTYVPVNFLYTIP